MYKEVYELFFYTSYKLCHFQEDIQFYLLIKLLKYTDSDAHLEGLRAYLHTIHNIQRVELLPYHTLGVNKYHALGIPYSLEDVPALLPEALADWQRRFDREFHI